MSSPQVFITADAAIPSQGYSTPTITLQADYPGHSKRIEQGTWVRQSRTVEVRWGLGTESPFSTGTETVRVYSLADSPLSADEVHALAEAWAASDEARAHWHWMRTGERAS